MFVFGQDRLAEVRGALDALSNGNAKYQRRPPCTPPVATTTPAATLPDGPPSGMATLSLVNPRQVTHARMRVQELPVAAGLEPEQALRVCTPADTAAITGLLFLFQRFILDVTIDMIRCTQALDRREGVALLDALALARRPIGPCPRVGGT